MSFTTHRSKVPKTGVCLLVAAVATLSVAVPASATSTHKAKPKAAAVPFKGLGTGIGATVAQMGRRHGVSYIRGGLCSAAPHCFGPGFSNEEGRGYQFTAVSVGDGIISEYTQAFNSNTTLSQAEAQILEWLPSDAQMSPVVIDHNGGSCAMFNITSSVLAKIFSAHPKIGDPTGVLGVELGYIDSNLNQVYNPNNIEHADLSVTPTDPTAAC